MLTAKSFRSDPVESIAYPKRSKKIDSRFGIRWPTRRGASRPLMALAYCLNDCASTENNPGSDGLPVTGDMFGAASAASWVAPIAGACDVRFE